MRLTLNELVYAMATACEREASLHERSASAHAAAAERWQEAAKSIQAKRRIVARQLSGNTLDRLSSCERTAKTASNGSNGNG